MFGNIQYFLGESLIERGLNKILGSERGLLEKGFN